MPIDVIVVVSSLFPRDGAPLAGVFIRERMFRVAKLTPLIVISPRPWSPFDWLVRLWRPAFRPQASRFEVMGGIDVYRPDYLSMPGIAKRLDGRLMAFAIGRCLRGLGATIRPVLLDAHFLYPDGYAASLVAAQIGVPLAVTIRGSKDQRLIGTSREFGLRLALKRAEVVIAVSEQLKHVVAVQLGKKESEVLVIGNGVDLDRFYPEDKALARNRLGLPQDSKVLVTVGTLIGLKGFHRVLDLMPELSTQWPNLHYLIVGGRSGHDDVEPQLRRMVSEHGLEGRVHFCGPQAPEDLRWYYSAADLFVLATEYEGWANVLLEAMACGTPVVTTDVGGNSQVVSRPDLGTLCPYWSREEFAGAINEALTRQWSPDALIAYARSNAWEEKIPQLHGVLKALCKVPDSRDKN